MTSKTPDELLNRLVATRSAGDIETALSCYEPSATIVVAPGVVASGSDSIRGVLDYFAASSARFTVERRSFIGTGDLCLHVSSWTLKGQDPTGQDLDVAGRSTDVVRRQPDGSWLLAIDNPWGSDLPNPVQPEGEEDE